MSRIRVLVLTGLAMLAFAGNSLLTRAALIDTGIDPASFTSVRLGSGAMALWLIVRLRAGSPSSGRLGSWPSAFALFAYAVCFSFAYVGLKAGTGALLLFGAVQATMIGWGLWRGERLHGPQWVGLLLAVSGLVALLLPGLSAPPLKEAVLMLAAGAAWGIYSIRGSGTSDPLQVTAGNFLRACLFTAVLSAALMTRVSVDGAGLLYAIASGAITSGLGYAIWYTALRGLAATVAATVQLSVPAIAALGGVALLDEALTPRLVLASAVVLGGIALFIVSAQSRRRT